MPDQRVPVHDTIRARLHPLHLSCVTRIRLRSIGSLSTVGSVADIEAWLGKLARCGVCVLCYHTVRVRYDGKHVR